MLAIFTIDIYNMPFCTCHTENDGIAPLITGKTLTEHGLSIPALGNQDLDAVSCIARTGGIEPNGTRTSNAHSILRFHYTKLSVSDTILKFKTIGLESNSHSNVTSWFTATSLDG